MILLVRYCAILLCLGMPILSLPQTGNAQEKEVVVRFKALSPSMLKDVSRHFPIDRMDDDGLIAYGLSDHLHYLDSMGIQYKVLPHPSTINKAFMAAAVSLPDTSWDFYPTYTAYTNLMNQFQNLYPSLCRIEEIGTLSSGRKILAAVISKNVDSTEAEPKFLYTSSMHGDELVGYVLMLRLINYLLEQYSQDSLVTRLVNNMEIWINPLANPDGTYASGNQTVNGATRYNANWVDINRNFPDPQDGPHPDNKPWQQETLHFMALAGNEQFNISANIHGGAEVCNYPWDTWSQLPADNDWWVQVCNQYADSAQYYGPSGYFNDFGTGVTNGYAWYSIDGGRQDYMNFFHRCREFTLEISNTKLPSASTLPGFWNANYRSFLRYMEQGLFGLQGQVTDSISGAPLNAMVFINGHDIDSSHVRTRLPMGDYYRYLFPGIYNVTYSSSGYHPVTIQGINILQNQSTIVDVALVPLNVSIPKPLLREGEVFFDNHSHQVIYTGEKGLNRVELFDLSGRLIWSHQGIGKSQSFFRIDLPKGYFRGMGILRAWEIEGATHRQPLVVKIII